jgi:molybdopterin-containing oxidoreductase family iron-sulfur binding subunit
MSGSMSAGAGSAVERREFLRLMGASLALGGLGACTRQPTERIYPYARFPERTIPGKPLFYATAMPFPGGAQPILVESHMGRPTKIEGNPEHPASLGATNAMVQAAILGLYDPDRSQVVKHAGRIDSWPAFLGALRHALEGLPADGTGLRILTETVISPTLASQIWALRSQRSGVVWHQYEPLNRNAASAGAKLAFGEDAVPLPRFDQAEIVLSLDSDFLGSGPAQIRHSRDFTSRRRPFEDAAVTTRLYAIESSFTITGAMADHRLALSPSRLSVAAREIASAVGVDLGPAGPDRSSPEDRSWIQALVDDLKAHAGRSVVVAGELQPPSIQALAHAMNSALGNVGKTIEYVDPIEMETIDQSASLRDLVSAMDKGEVSALVILEGNPAYAAPAEFGFSDGLARVPFRAHLSLYEDETSELCDWHVPAAHFLESWSDTNAYDGTTTIVQPLIAPLYEGRTAHEMLSALAGRLGISPHDSVSEYWKNSLVAQDFDTLWARALHDGWLPETALKPKQVHIAASFAQQVSAAKETKADGETIELLLRPDPTVWDGRFANNAWLQELPKPLTQLTWGNAVLVSPKTAERLGIRSEDRVEIEGIVRSLPAPAWIVPGHADGCATLHLGNGRRRAGNIGSGVGFDAFRLLPAEGAWRTPAARMRRAAGSESLACTQLHHSMEGRDLARATTLGQFISQAASEHSPEAELASLNPPPAKGEHAWGMVIDLSTCTGCSACVVACQAENNIPVVGKEEVQRGREMHWIRIDQYFEGKGRSPEVRHQPVPCMHCENAPCELVCPVGATTHSIEGLNDMTYNRCVGTRYCEANCPYKVRRFNFYLYADLATPSLKMLRNPDVTVRTRGVMEKCTYCVQRINETRIKAQLEGRAIRDGEIVTACQQVCPATAITFGDVSDPKSAVSRLRHQKHAYGLLAELGTKPRTTYLTRIVDPNPLIKES